MAANVSGDRQFEGPPSLVSQLLRYLPRTPSHFLMLTICALVAFLALYPISWLIFGSFRSGPPFEPGYFTIGNYLKAYADPFVYVTAKNTVIFAFGQTVGAVTVGTTLAWIVARTNTPGRTLFEFLTLILFLFPLLLAVFAWTMLLSPTKGLINNALVGLGFETAPFDIYSMGGMIFVQSLYVAPLAFLIIAPVFASIDSSLEESARMSGAGTFKTLFRVTLPLARPAIASSAVFLFIVGLESFEVPILLGAPRGVFTYTSLIYTEIAAKYPSDYGVGTSLAMSLLVTTLLAIYIYRRLVARSERFETVRGKGHRAEPIDLGPWRWLTSALCWLFFVFTVFMPAGILVMGSFLQFFGRFDRRVFDRMTLANYPEVLRNPALIDALINSLLLAVIAGAVCVLFSAVVAYITIKSKIRGRGLLDGIAMLPISFPATVLGLALLWAWITIPLPIYGTIFILGIAYITRYLPLSLRTVSGGLIQLSDEFEEAARMSGASWFYVFRRVILPLMRPALAAAWLLMFMIFIRELGMSVLLVGTNNRVLSVLMFSYYELGELGVLSTISVLLMVLIILIVFLARRFLGISYSRFEAGG